MVKNANTIWPDGPASSPIEPRKDEIREWGTDKEGRIAALEAASSTGQGGLTAEIAARQAADSALGERIDGIESTAAAGYKFYATKVAMTADTGQADGTRAIVDQDSTASNNGIYVSASGAWTKIDEYTQSEVVAARGGAANLSLGLDARVRQAKTRAPNLIFNGNLDNFGAGVTLFSDLLSNPASYPARIIYEINDPTLRRLGCKYGLYVNANTGGLNGNAVCHQVRVVGGYMFVSCLVYNPAGDVWNFGTQNGPTATVRYRDGSTQTATPAGGMSSFEAIAPGVRRYFATIALTANKPTLRVEIGSFSSTSRGADYALTGFWASHSRNSGLTIADTAFPDWTVTKGRRAGIPALKRDLADQLHSVNCIAIGDSITWGSGATGMGESEPRTHELSDPRNNSTSPCWVNLLRNWMGAVGAAGQGFTDATVLTDGIAEFRQKQVISPADNRIGYWSGSTPWTKNITVVSSATAGRYIGIAPGNFIDFEFTGDELDIHYGTQTADAAGAFTVSVDGSVVATQNTYAASSTFGNKVTISPTFGRHYVRVTASADPVGTNIDGIVHNRLVRLQNQGINGTWAGEWVPFDSSGLYTGVPATATHLLIQLGTNDRSLSLGPAVGLYERVATICRYMLATAPSLAITILCANKALGTKEVFGDPALYGYDMSEVRRQLLRVAQEFGLSFVDQYSLTARMDLDGESFTGDNLHPNDAGYLAMYRNIVSEIDAAPLIEPS